MPGAIAVTTPACETVANVLFDDCHVDSDVTSCVVPSPIVAIALNCELVPLTGTTPVTATAVTVLADVDELLHAPAASAAAIITIAIDPIRIACMIFVNSRSQASR